MIRLPNRTLPAQVQKELDQYQQAIDSLPDYPSRVAGAAKDFAAHNRKGNKTFDAVKDVLTEMCSGARRCAYCEDSLADEVEHVKPKNLYPEAAFLWPNYVYACGPCNGPKNNKFAVFDQATGKPVDVTRKRNMPVVPPRPGAPVLIDPRTEDPGDYLELELRSTFYFLPRTGIGAAERIRAQYTIDTLQLNKRDVLPKARQQAYLDYVALVSQYRLDRDGGASTQALGVIEKQIRGRNHPTVWSEMKRQHDLIPALKRLFASVPEALGW